MKKTADAITVCALVRTCSLAVAQDVYLDPDLYTDRMVPVTLTEGSSRDMAVDIIVREDLKIVVVGNSESATSIDLAIARLDPDGSLDKTFSVDGRATLDLDITEGANLQYSLAREELIDINLL